MCWPVRPFVLRTTSVREVRRGLWRVPFEFIAKVRQLGEATKYGVLWRVKKCKSTVIGADAGAGAGCVLLQCCNVAMLH